MTAPKWAQDLVIKVALESGLNDLPDLIWRRSDRKYTGGVYHRQRILPYQPRPPRIVITAGHDRIDQKLALLHELAHWISNEGHTPRFYRVGTFPSSPYPHPLREAA